MIELCSMENLNALSDGIFTISGVIIGAIFTFITQMMVNHFNSKNERLIITARQSIFFVASITSREALVYDVNISTVN